MKIFKEIRDFAIRWRIRRFYASIEGFERSKFNSKTENERDCDRRRKAFHLLLAIRSAEAVIPLLEILEWDGYKTGDCFGVGGFESAIIKAIADIQRVEVIPASRNAEIIEKMFAFVSGDRHGDIHMKLCAEIVIKNTGTECVPYVLGQLNSDKKSRSYAAINILCITGEGSRAVPKLLEILKTACWEDLDSRLSAISLLGKTGDKQAVNPLLIHLAELYERKPSITDEVRSTMKVIQALGGYIPEGTRVCPHCSGTGFYSLQPETEREAEWRRAYSDDCHPRFVGGNYTCSQCKGTGIIEDFQFTHEWLNKNKQTLLNQ